jgi:hypothetical protein
MDKTARLVRWQRLTIGVLLAGIIGTAMDARYEHYQSSDIPAHLSHALDRANRQQEADNQILHDQDDLLRRYRAKFGEMKSMPCPLTWSKVENNNYNDNYLFLAYRGTPRHVIAGKGTTERSYAIKYGRSVDGRWLCILTRVLKNAPGKEIEIARDYGDIRESVRRLQHRAEADFPQTR